MNDPDRNDIQALLPSTSDSPEDTAQAAICLREHVEAEDQRGHKALAKILADGYPIVLQAGQSDTHYHAVVDRLKHKDPRLKLNGQKKILTVSKLIFGYDYGTADAPEYKTASRRACMQIELIARRVSADHVQAYLEDNAKPEHLLKGYRDRKRHSKEGGTGAFGYTPAGTPLSVNWQEPAKDLLSDPPKSETRHLVAIQNVAADGAVAIEIIGEDPHGAWRAGIVEQGLVALCLVGSEEQISAFEASSGRSTNIRTEVVETPGAPRALKLVRIGALTQNSPAAQQRQPATQSTPNRPQQSNLLPPGLRALSNRTSGTRNGVNTRQAEDAGDDAEWE